MCDIVRDMVESESAAQLAELVRAFFDDDEDGTGEADDAAEGLRADSHKIASQLRLDLEAFSAGVARPVRFDLADAAIAQVLAADDDEGA